MKPVVLLDIDGVVADFIGGLCSGFRKNGLALTPEDFRSWDLHQTLRTPTEMVMAHNIVEEPGFCLGLDPYPESLEFIKNLQELAEVHPLTSPWIGAPLWSAERALWCREMGLTNYPIFARTEQKSMVRGSILIEDRAETCEAWSKANPGGVCVLLDRPWNQTGIGPRTARAKSYHEIIKALQIVFGKV